MRGLVTERDFTQAEQVFPGIARLYARLTPKPATFLELVWAYQRLAQPA